MKIKKLIIFIDALPYEYNEHFNKYISDWGLKLRKLRPGYGFSSNQHNLLLRGLNPDKVGFFTDYKIIKDQKFKFYLRHDSWLNYIIRKIQSKLGFEYANIPIGLGDKFKNNSVYPLKSKQYLDSLTKIFDKWEFEADQSAHLFLETNILNRNTILVFNEIDHLGHYAGVNSHDYKFAVKQLFKKIDGFIKTNKCEVILFSDHGMSLKPSKVKLILENHFGRQSLLTYNYFIDSTTLRVWTYSKDKYNQIIKFLEKKKIGKLIDAKTKKKYGISNAEYGDIIFVLHEQYFFEPQYFGFGLKSKTLGMHGNIPTDKWQCGVWAGSSKLPNCNDSLLFYSDVLLKFLK